MKIHVQRLALTAGIIWGGAIFITTLAAVYFNYGVAFLNGIASVYPGYTITPIGSFVGGIYGFIDAFVGVYIAIWLYRKLEKVK